MLRDEHGRFVPAEPEDTPSAPEDSPSEPSAAAEQPPVADSTEETSAPAVRAQRAPGGPHGLAAPVGMRLEHLAIRAGGSDEAGAVMRWDDAEIRLPGRLPVIVPPMSAAPELVMPRPADRMRAPLVAPPLGEGTPRPS